MAEWVRALRLYLALTGVLGIVYPHAVPWATEWL